MNQKSLTKLEFPKIIEMLTDHASSPGGASFCRRIIKPKEEEKVKTKAKKATYIRGQHGSGAAKMKADIRRKRANRHKK